MSEHEPFGEILRRLIERYRLASPEFRALEVALRADGAIGGYEQLGNDHIAFRTLGAPQLGIASLEPLLFHHGYVRQDAYHFAAKHLDAYWYRPPSDELPRVFISELRINDLSVRAAETLRRYTDAVTAPPLACVDFNAAAAVAQALNARPWSLPTLPDYQALLAESEYAAWTVVNAYLINHSTVSVHDLRPDLQSVATLNTYLERHGFVLNDAGGKVKLSPDGLLLQSSTVAPTRDVVFADGGAARVAGPYIEFAERRVLPEFEYLAESDVRREHRRDGFEAANADRIFESTDVANRA